MRKLVSILLAATLLFSSVGCVKKVQPGQTPEPPAIVFQRTLLGAADATAVLASSAQAVNECRKQLADTKQITPEQSEAIHKYIKTITARNEAAVQAIKVSEMSGDIDASNWRTQMLSVVAAVQDIDPSLFGVKNENAKASLRSALAGLSSVAQVVAMSFGGK